MKRDSARRRGRRMDFCRASDWFLSEEGIPAALMRTRMGRLVPFQGSSVYNNMHSSPKGEILMSANKFSTFVMLLSLAMVLLGATLSLAAQEMPGVPAGKSAPPFRARDQFGKEQTLSSLVGPNGLVLLFFRSADW